jgi:predicted glycosyltransferase
VRIWYDALTGKHVRYGAAVAKRFRQQGHDVILTTRKHPDTVELAKILKERFLVVGDYDPTSLQTRLQASLKRMLELSKLFEDNIPDIAICSQSVDLCRVAFGLGIPILLTADTAYAVAVNKLTLPLANTVITSEALPKRLLKNFGAQNIVHFKGVDEAAWIKDFKPLGRLDFKKPIIVVRQMETKASYAVGTEDATKRIAHKLSSLGTVLFLPRYDKQQGEGFVVAKEFVDSASMVAHADLVIGAGGTISREAALQGTPSIVISQFGRIHVNEYLSRKDFPIFITAPSKVLALAKKYSGKKWDVKAKLRELENPVELIEKLATKTQIDKHHMLGKSREED